MALPCCAGCWPARNLFKTSNARSFKDANAQFLPLPLAHVKDLGEVVRQLQELLAAGARAWQTWPPRCCQALGGASADGHALP